ncbi:pirin family protein [Lacinutrix sp. C3R15]|uniref:pirin family protein n=1 Tax=Flavobacteriaceae TaxID=49546 RepID=UPI001C08BB5A|nr:MULTISPECIES: pirin family protein [Flavobacteriaceae]MBU2938744.1 pirin family protein [Lacinutrix sp. C3R15]MDO6622057.1 pirin family protein [Oceanihabitans sp. 1_MG-2023]
MKTIIHKAASRGFANHGWLQANHSFSFANFYDKDKMHFGALRVLNDDIIAPKMGFGTHPHDNMEIITIPLKGVLKHRDNIVHEAWQQVVPGEVQVMSAGTGVQHSEINGSVDAYLSLFQIWIIPNKQNVSPRYDQKLFNLNDRNNKLQILVSSIDEAIEGTLKIHQDTLISRIRLTKGNNFTYTLKSKNHGVYIMNIHGELEVNSEIVQARDAIGVSETDSFEIKAIEDSEILFIEVPML